MAETKHTPGPWVVHKYPHATGDLWLGIGYRLPDGTECGPICDIVSKQYEGIGTLRHAAEIKYLVTPEDEQWANARLIASAPGLLADNDALRADRDALMAALVAVQGGGGSDCWCLGPRPFLGHSEECEQARAALDRVKEGRE